MVSIPTPSVPAPLKRPSAPLALSQVGRAAHDLGMAGLLGGNLYGRLALHPSVTTITDRAERGKLVNAAWRRYGVINSLSLLAVGAGWIGARADDAAEGRLSAEERKLARAKDVLVGVVAATGLLTAVQGVRFSKTAPDGAVPLTDGDHAAPEASVSARRAKRRLNVLGTAALASEVGLVAVNAALAQAGHRRPPLRRRLVGRFA